MSFLDGLLERAEVAKSFGYETTSWGARLYGHVPHVAPEAWFHRFYAGLSLDELEVLEDRLRAPLPTELKDFFREANGLSIFDRSLEISGLRTDYSRGPESGSFPFAMETTNNFERPEGCLESYLFIGSYFDDGSKLVFDRATGQVHWLPRWQPGPVLRTWNGLKEMLETEADRLAQLFDNQGRLLVPNGSTLPPR